MEELKELLDRVDMESYLDREGIQYRLTNGSRGLQLNVRECPKCGGDKWKVFLNADTGLGNCFSGSCEFKFNKWSFIDGYLGLSKHQTYEHIKQVASEMGWRPPKRISKEVQLEVPELKLPASYAIPIRNKNLKYLENRGITGDIAKFFHLRLSLEGKFWYEIEGKKCAQDYANRIVIPIFDLEGELVGFQGRDITGKAEKKYLFPPGYASTGKYLYNGQNCVGLDTVVMGEGAFDVIAIKMALDTDTELRAVGALGSFGKHLSHGEGETQVTQFLRLKEAGLKNIVIMWDGEVAATDDAVDTAKLLKDYGFNVRIAYLPKDKDPNEIPAKAVVDAYYKALPYNASIATRLKLARRKE
ncbi:DNA primase, catalytic core, N-terminal [uncultured Caudovirales phage]|uniref:DNA primase, catalytic core, N-terminal n=1 Tax=uncultured Caudovirales phage TaxID=2100421 RepID=A0A6J7WS58_9CAUD|nr:DNA primase, catalytic core, N-terminal [uncultured Caudovirales phage]CAB4123984.1 DNA primase, catalytic core, N-terminal [uncultured Caudovirales phage]CAB5219572.1 DNA primase, catalytic core, N-terminal [uncultured Caudovirales phage]